MIVLFWTVWAVAGVMAGRYVVGRFWESVHHPDGAEVSMGVLMFVACVLFAPVAAVGVGVWAGVEFIRRTPVAPSISKGFKWFFTLDRQKRKAIFAEKKPEVEKLTYGRGW